MKKFYIVFSFIFLFTLILRAQDGMNVWTTTTTSVGPVYAMTIDPSNTDIMYTGSSTLGIYKTTDAGATWTSMNSGLLNTSVISLAISQSNPQIIYAGTNSGTNDGVYKSTDGGGNWTRLINGIQETSRGIQAIAVDPTNPDVAYIAVFDGLVDSPVGLYKTTDGGANWNSAVNGIGAIKNFLAIAIDPSNSNILYAGTSFTVATSSGPSTIYKSTDAGASWTEVNNGLPTDPTDINPVRAISISSTDPNVVIAAFFMNSADLLGGLYVSTDAGASWTQKWNGAPNAVGTLLRSCTIRPGSTQEFYVGLDISTVTNIGVWQTTDGGNTWASFNGGTMQSTYQIRALNFKNVSGEMTIYAGSSTSPGGVYEYTFPVVPVELTSFTADVSGNSVLLNWSTATETNNKGFNIERKSVGGTWATIGFVPGRGTTAEPASYSYTDNSVASGNYTYRLKQIDFDGSYKYSSEAAADVIAVNSYTLAQNYPNPFNPSTTINYTLPSDQFISIRIYNVLGAEVASLVNERQGQGRHTVHFDASRLHSGIYYYTMTAGNYRETKKMMLLK